jgi:hypothetical protein
VRGGAVPPSRGRCTVVHFHAAATTARPSSASSGGSVRVETSPEALLGHWLPGWHAPQRARAAPDDAQNTLRVQPLPTTPLQPFLCWGFRAGCREGALWGTVQMMMMMMTVAYAVHAGACTCAYLAGS